MSHRPWHVSDHAVRRFMAFTHEPSFEVARARLTRLCAETWAYYAETGRLPKVTARGAQIYRMRAPEDERTPPLKVIVSPMRRADTNCSVVDIGVFDAKPPAPWRRWFTRRR